MRLAIFVIIAAIVGFGAAMFLMEPATFSIVELEDGFPDPMEPATYGDLDLESGFTPDPYSVEIVAGGETDTFDLGPDCIGDIAFSPDLQLEFTPGVLPLYIYVASDADTSLVVNTPSADWVCDDDSGEGLNPTLTFEDPEEGIYDIWVGVVDDSGYSDAMLYISELGFDIDTDVADAPAPAEPLVAKGPDDRLERGKLELGDAVRPTGEYQDRFTFDGSIGDQVVIDLRSQNFDSYLFVRTPSGVEYENDDFEGDRRRSLLTLGLGEAGEYEVLVSSYMPEEEGRYALLIAPQTVAALEPMVEHAGTLGAGDDTRPSGAYVDTYEFAGAPGRRLSLDLTSDDFDTYLILISPSGEVLENDDTDRRGHSVIDSELTEAGDYEVRVTSYDPEETGAYRLLLERSEVLTADQQSSRDTVELNLGEAASGRLEQGDLQPEGKYQDIYAFRGTAGQNIRIELTSSEFDTYLILNTPGETTLSNDDFEESLERSVIEMTLTETGRHQVIVTSYYADDVGAYQLVASLAAAPVAPPLVATDDGGTVYGIFAGISNYGGRMGNLDYTADDAVLARDALINSAGMAAGNAITLLDADASTANMRQAFQDLSSRVGPNDVFVFFFSGHGAQVVRPEGPEAADADGLDETIELYDAAIRDDELRDMLDQIESKMTLIILDSCFSGGFAKDLGSAPGRMGLYSSEELVTSLVALKFRAGGFLSHFFKEAVEDGRGDTDGSSTIEVHELGQYLHERYVLEQQSKSSYVSIPDFSYQHLVVDYSGVRPDDLLFLLH